MSSMDVGIIGKGFLSENLEKAAKQFPHSTEKVLKKEARNIAKDLKKRVQQEAKGHHYHGKVTSEQESEIIKNRLENSFRQGKVVKNGSEYSVAVTSKAPHYHFYEDGHALVSHSRKSKNGKAKAGTGKYIKDVPGRKTVARYMAQRSEYSELIGQELLNEILKDAGLD